MSIITLYKQGISQRQISKIVGHDRKTVRRIIRRYKEDGITEPVKMSKELVLDKYKDKITHLTHLMIFSNYLALKKQLG